jgi:hypothetical protein
MPRSLSLRYLLFKTLLIPIIRVFSPRAESATFLFATMQAILHQSSATRPGLVCSIKILESGVLKSRNLCSPHGLDQSTESPILFRSCGHETPFSDQKGVSKIGDSVLWFGLRSFEKNFETAFPNVRSDLQNFRFGRINLL